MLFLKSVLLIAVLQLVLASNEDLKLLNVPKELRAETYERLENCVRNTCSKNFKVDIDKKSEYQSCQIGCHNHHVLGKNCDGFCNSINVEHYDSCIMGCNHKFVQEPKEKEEPPKVIDDVKAPTPVEPAKPVDDQKPKEKIEEPKIIDDIKAPPQVAVDAEGPRPSLIDAIGALQNENNNNNNDLSDKDAPPNLIDGIENIFKPFLIKGEPGSQDPVFIEIKPIDDSNEEDDDSDSNSSSSESKEKPAIAIDEPKQQEGDAPTESSSFGFLNPMNIMSMVNSVIERAQKLGKGDFYYYAKFLDNGTVVEKFEKPTESSEIKLDGANNDDAPFRIMNALLNNHHMVDADNVDLDDHHHAGLHPNWKGRPLAIGKPVIEELDDFNRQPPFRMYRECRPISFHFSTLCHDLNNFFNCVSMRTGLPRWFFMSLILLCSFFMLWLGLFILSMIRRMKRQERVIQYEEDQLPLYKDIVFEEKRPPTYTDSEPLPEKLKFETA